MTWQVRHEGAAQSVQGLSLDDLLEGLRDGRWEPTDEAIGPGESAWVAIENHPQLAETAADLEPPLPRTYDDETRVDMNALIDVCLVLLIFFMLTTSYAALQKRIEAPGMSRDKAKVAVLTKKQVEEQTIHVTAKMEGGQPVVRVEGRVVDPGQLQGELSNSARGTHKTTLLLEHDDEVTQDLVVQIIAAARGAGMDKVQQVVP